jgi:hypothetical protein
MVVIERFHGLSEILQLLFVERVRESLTNLLEYGVCRTGFEVRIYSTRSDMRCKFGRLKDKRMKQGKGGERRQEEDTECRKDVRVG